MTNNSWLVLEVVQGMRCRITYVAPSLTEARIPAAKAPGLSIAEALGADWRIGQEVFTMTRSFADALTGDPYDYN